MPTNDFLQFCPTDSGTNLPTQGDYSASSTRTSGAVPGTASSKYNNKPLRQATAVTSQIAQVLANKANVNILDDGTVATLFATINMLWTRIDPVITALASGSGTFVKTYGFFIASGSATTGATYTNNTFTFTVVTTVAAGTFIKMSGTGAPTDSGTLTKSGGTGDATLTFGCVRAPLYLRVVMTGGGGGGGGSGTTNGTAATAGADTTFGTALLSAGGGAVGTRGGNTGGAGGAASLGTGPVGIAYAGSTGQGGAAQATSGACFVNGGQGGGNALGGAGGGGLAGPGTAAIANTGGGGGGAGTASTVTSNNSGAGAGSGAYINAIITSPLATYAYVVGAGGTGQAAGTAGAAGGAGGSGYIIVEQHYQ